MPAGGTLTPRAGRASAHTAPPIHARSDGLAREPGVDANGAAFPQRPAVLEGPARCFPGGARGRSGSVAVLLAAAGPDEGEGLAVLVVEEIGVDRSVEARIVELDREIVAALAGALRPGGPDLGATDKDPVAGGVVVGPVGSGTMRTPLVWTLRVTISPWNSWPDFLKVPMLAMSLLLAVRARDHRGLDGDLQAEGDRRRTPSGRSAAEDGGGETFLPREEWAEPRGRKSRPPPLRHRRSRRSRPSARSSHQRPAWLAGPTASQEKTWRISSGPHKRSGSSGEGKETLAGKMGGPSSNRQPGQRTQPASGACVRRGRRRSIEAP